MFTPNLASGRILAVAGPRTPNGEIHGQLDAPNKDAAFATCTKNLHVDVWSWVIGHGELESGVYFDRGGRRAARFVFFFVAP